MQNIKIQNTNKTPRVILQTDGLIEIKGNSLIENTQSFYSKIIKWLKEYIKQPATKTVVNFAMDYYNTSSQMWIFQIVNVLTDLYRLEYDISFNWYYVDSDLKESGEDLAILLNIQMNLIESDEAFIR